MITSIFTAIAAAADFIAAYRKPATRLTSRDLAHAWGHDAANAVVVG